MIIYISGIIATVLILVSLDLFDFHENNENIGSLTLLRHILTPYLMNLGYNIIYVYSVCQIKLNKFKRFVSLPLIKVWKRLIKYLEDNKWINNVDFMSLVKIDVNGNMEDIIYYPKTCEPKLIKNLYKNKNYCFIFSDKQKNTNCINKVFYDNFPDSFDYKVSKINFMFVELEYNNNTYTITLKNDNSNYYIVNNTLNQNFIKYYLKSVLQIKENIKTEEFVYKLSIIDNDANFITLTSEQQLVFKEDSYEIITNNN